MEKINSYMSENGSAFCFADPFHGVGAVELPEPQGIARFWDWRKAQTGNCHPGACYPLGMVSVCPYSGMYPTGYGVNDVSSEYAPNKLLDRRRMNGVTHFHVSGTGGVGNYYNYFKVSPLSAGLDVSAPLPLVAIEKESAVPGYYSCLSENGISTELTIAARGAAHRYSGAEVLLFDLMHGGLTVSGNPNFQTFPDDVDYVVNGNSVDGYVVMRGVKIFFHALCPGSKIVRHPKGAVIHPGGNAAEFFIGFSFSSQEMAADVCRRLAEAGFDEIRQAAADVWNELLGRINVGGGTPRERGIFYSCLYRSLIKPCESTEISGRSSFYDFATMWDQYKTQLPLLFTVYPEYGKRIASAMLNVIEKEGCFPNALLLENSEDRFSAQASGLAVHSLYDAFIRGLIEIPAAELVDLMLKTLKNGSYYGDFVKSGFVLPASHTLDLAEACNCVAKIARIAGNDAAVREMSELSGNWKNAYDLKTGLLREDSEYYEGTRWNYSFRLLHDMPERMRLCGGKEAFVALLERFFGYCDNIPCGGDFSRLIRDDRFEGLNNEPDMETPYSFSFAGRHDRTAEVVRSVMRWQFDEGYGGLPGNDDSGGLSSWYVWNAIGLFPVTGQNIVMAGSPLFDSVRIKTGEGIFSININNNSSENIYLKSLSLNGAILDNPWFPVEKLRGDSALSMELTGQV